MEARGEWIEFTLEARQTKLLTISSTPGDSIVNPCRKDPAGPDDRSELPWKGGELFLFLDGVYEEWDRVVELHKKWHFVMPASSERSFYKAGLNDRDVDAFVLDIESDAFEECGHRGFASGVGGGFRKTTESGEARDRDERSAMLFQHIRQDGVHGINCAVKIYVDDFLYGVGPERSSLGIISTDTGVGDENIDSAEFISKGTSRLLDRNGVSDIGREYSSGSA